MHLQSRTAAFRLCFLQRLLNGSVTSSWKVVACKILQQLGNLKMDRNLFFYGFFKAEYQWNAYFLPKCF